MIRRGLGVSAGPTVAGLAAVAGAAECAPPLTLTPTVVGVKFCADTELGAAVLPRVGCGRDDVSILLAARRSSATTRCAPPPPPRRAPDDEWNIAVRINRTRGVGDQLAMFFDGRPASPAEMDTEIAPGYEVR